MEIINFDSPLKRDPSCLVSKRGSMFLHYVMASGEVSVVNKAGQEVLNLFSTLLTPREAIHLLNEKQMWTVQSIARFLTFIENMVERGILQSTHNKIMPAITRNNSNKNSDYGISDIYLHITNRCNLRCLYCYNADFRASGSVKDELTLDELKKLLDQMAKLSIKRVIFTGGEPLLRNDCIEAAQYAKSIGMTTSCLTNGTLLAEKATEVSEAFDEVVVSIDSWRPEEQEFLRPGEKLAKIIAGVRSLTDIDKSRVWIRSVITRYNINSILDFPRFAVSQLNCSNFMLALCNPTNIENFNNIELLPKPEMYRKMIRKYITEVEKVNGHSSLQTDFLEAIGRCGAGRGLLSVAPNGDVYPCQCLHFPYFYSGNIRRNSLREIWLESHEDINEQDENQFRFIACTQCPYSKLCPLSCRAVHYAFRDYQSAFTSVMCSFAQLEIEERLWNKADHVICKL